MWMKSLILFFTPFVLDKYLMISLQGSTYKEIYIDFFILIPLLKKIKVHITLLVFITWLLFNKPQQFLIMKPMKALSMAANDPFLIKVFWDKICGPYVRGITRNSAVWLLVHFTEISCISTVTIPVCMLFVFQL